MSRCFIRITYTVCRPACHAATTIAVCQSSILLPKLSARQFEQMLELLAGLTAAERAMLKDPDFIT
jgi:hypothetical protein